MPDTQPDRQRGDAHVQFGQEPYCSAGYVITRPISVSANVAGQEATPIFSLSPHFAPFAFVPDQWALDWMSFSDDERRQAAAAFGITPALLPVVIDWVTTHFVRFHDGEMAWRDVFNTLAAARTFIKHFLVQCSDLVLLGIGVPQGSIPAFLNANRPEPGIASFGYYDLLQRCEPLASGGELLGFEVVGLGPEALYSWRCNGWEQIASQDLGIFLGRYGLLRTLDEGLRAAAHRYPPNTEDEVAALWQPWLVVRYPLAG
ncbi:MAG TPA: hypothetical protein VF818_05005 [Ktedonobacterales bacterium]